MQDRVPPAAVLQPVRDACPRRSVAHNGAMPIAFLPLPMALPRKSVPARSALNGADIGTPGSANTDGAHVVQAGGATVAPYVGNGAGMQSTGRAWLGPVALLPQAWWVQISRAPQVSAAAMARLTAPICLSHLPQRRARIAPRVDHTSIRRRRA